MRMFRPRYQAVGLLGCLYMVIGLIGLTIILFVMFFAFGGCSYDPSSEQQFGAQYEQQRQSQDTIRDAIRDSKSH